MPRNASHHQYLFAVSLLTMPMVLLGCQSDSSGLIWDNPALADRMTRTIPK
jgi:hypothetical protein